MGVLGADLSSAIRMADFTPLTGVGPSARGRPQSGIDPPVRPFEAMNWREATLQWICARGGLGATIVRFHYAHKAPARFRLLLLTLSLLATVPANAGRKATSPMGLFPSSSFTVASGSTFHHTLYHEAKLRTAPRSGQERQDFRTNSEHDAGCETHPYV